MDWFENWFDSEYYHILYKNRDDNEAQLFLDNLLSKTELPEGASILDLACGKGRHAKYLASKGYFVTGTDLSANSIDTANESSSDHLSFEVHDMRSPMNMEFDAVFNLFTSIGYFNNLEDNKAVFAAINSMLKQDGLFVIDFMNVNKVESNLVEHELKEVDGITFRINRKIEDGKILKSIRFEDKGKSHHFEEKVQALTREDFIGLIESSGLGKLFFFGDYFLNEFDPQESDRLIIIGSKL